MCITDGPSKYGSNEFCEFEVVDGITLRAVEYDVKKGDLLTFNGQSYRKGNKINGEYYGPGTIVQWTTNGKKHGNGFLICGELSDPPSQDKGGSGGKGKKDKKDKEDKEDKKDKKDKKKK